MIAIFCAVIMLSADRTTQATRGAGDRAIRLPSAPALVVGNVADVGG